VADGLGAAGVVDAPGADGVADADGDDGARTVGPAEAGAGAAVSGSSEPQPATSVNATATVAAYVKIFRTTATRYLAGATARFLILIYAVAGAGRFRGCGPVRPGLALDDPLRGGS
jgi:hypothetical protein